MKTFKAVAVDGTFDQLHRGHKALLIKHLRWAESPHDLTIDNFVASLARDIELHPAMIAFELELYLSMRVGLKETKLAHYRPYGPAIYIADLDAIVVSEETEKIAQSINYMRQLGYNPLQVIVVCMIPRRIKTYFYRKN